MRSQTLRLVFCVGFFARSQHNEMYSKERCALPQWQDVRNTVNRLLRSRFSSFGLVGIGLTIGGAVFIGLASKLGMSTDVANLIQAIFSVMLNLAFNYLFTWGDRRNLKLRSIIGRFIIAKFLTVPTNQVIFQVTESLFGSFFPQPLFGVITDWLVAYCVSTGLIMLMNYRLMDRFVFGQGSLRVDAKLALKMWKRPRWRP